MNIFQLVCFLAVAENLSFARAAEQLHITQPAVTQQIRTLEKELGARLFIRTTRSVKLTEEGKSFFIDARQMVEISERAKKRFENPFGTEIATLAIGCSNYPSMFLLSTALRRTAAGRPDFHPRLQLVSFLQIQRAIDDGGLDAVISFREAASMRISAVYEELAKVPLVCICHSEHPLAQRCSVTMDELKNERLVLFTPSRTSPVVADVQSGLMGGRAPSEFYFCDSGEAVVALVCRCDPKRRRVVSDAVERHPKKLRRQSAAALRVRAQKDAGEPQRRRCDGYLQLVCANAVFIHFQPS